MMMRATLVYHILVLPVIVFCSNSDQNPKAFQAKVQPTNIHKSTYVYGFLCDHNEPPYYTTADVDEALCQAILEAAENPDTWLVLKGNILLI